MLERIKNNREIAKGEKSAIKNGEAKPTIPKTKLEGITTAPIRSPKISQVSSFLAEEIAK